MLARSIGGYFYHQRPLRRPDRGQPQASGEFVGRWPHLWHISLLSRAAGCLLRLSYLAPDITQAILDRRQPRDLTADKLLAHSRLPLA